MSAYGPSIFSDDLASEIRAEYNALLGMGISNGKAEELLIQHYRNFLFNDTEENDVFWFALAMAEWNKGRLSEYVRKMALERLNSEQNLKLWFHNAQYHSQYEARAKVLSDFRNKLLYQKIPPKKIRKITVHHCPWNVGSLLAYRIINQPELKGETLFGKYALLRIVKIIRRPISKILPNMMYNEYMCVGLYGWCGDDIPPASIVETLSYIPIVESTPMLSSDVYSMLMEKVSNAGISSVNDALLDITKPQITTWVELSYRNSKYEVCDYTYIDCDSSYEEHLPDFFTTQHTGGYNLTHPRAFDFDLVRKLKPYYREKT